MSGKRKNGSHGREGGCLDIICSYPDGYQNVPKYLCLHPCTTKNHVLIKSEKANDVVQNGRFSLYDNVHGRTFTVTIKHLESQDAGSYYCGLDQWGRDVMIKVEVSVSKGM